MKYETLRTFLLIGWATTIAFVVAAFGIAYLSPAIRPEPTILVTSFGAIIGLLSPHLTLIYEFFLTDQVQKRGQLPKAVGATLMAMCALYWIVFIGCVWIGIVERAFSPAGGDGKGLDTTTALVTALAGTLSFLAIRPTTRLFVLANTPEALDPNAQKPSANAA